ncbi:hypothetical protein N657DRAFT_645147 [Parathielavia appendiculata]|uniref:Uncharacterized protein n=1 Tax=Parathielavia appendiculata TaxID=2587402 RepID=A0AAN6Z498_9PEZI|nr:hypothetical protein N657DRAFT_645147 [Parathielavia appendiculata]
MKRVVLSSQEDGTQSNSSTSPSSPPPVENTRMQRTVRQQKQSLPPELMEILVPSLKVGAAAGACGLFAGAVAGIVRSAPTVFFSVIAGGQWFTLATSYSATRLVSLKHFAEDEPTPGDKLKASTVAGGVAGTLGGLLRGPRNVIPGALMFSLFGAGGQAIANWRSAKAALSSATNTPPKSGRGFWSKWSPITPLSDEDYEKILEEKLLRVEADIALVDDRIKEIRESKSQKAKDEAPGSEKPSSAPSSKA